jgi:hypothetical protein
MCVVMSPNTSSEAYFCKVFILIPTYVSNVNFHLYVVRNQIFSQILSTSNTVCVKTCSTSNSPANLRQVTNGCFVFDTLQFESM